MPAWEGARRAATAMAGPATDDKDNPASRDCPCHHSACNIGLEEWHWSQVMGGGPLFLPEEDPGSAECADLRFWFALFMVKHAH